MSDDDALLRAVHAHWVLVAEEEDAAALAAAAAHHGGNGHALNGNGSGHSRAEALRALAASDPKDEKVAAAITEAGVVVGSAAGSSLRLEGGGVSPSHARVARQGQDYYVTDMGSEAGTYLNGRRLASGASARLLPGDVLRFGAADTAGSAGGLCRNTFKVKMHHESLAAGAQHGAYRREQTPAATKAFAVYGS